MEYKGERVAEGLSLTNSAFVLGKRFGMRTHRYIEHVNKVFSASLLWPDLYLVHTMILT